MEEVLKDRDQPFETQIPLLPPIPILHYVGLLYPASFGYVNGRPQCCRWFLSLEAREGKTHWRERRLVVLCELDVSQAGVCIFLHCAGIPMLGAEQCS